MPKEEGKRPYLVKRTVKGPGSLETPSFEFISSQIICAKSGQILPHILPTKEKGKYVEFFVKRSKYSISKRRRSRPVCQNDVI